MQKDEGMRRTCKGPLPTDVLHRGSRYPTDCQVLYFLKTKKLHYIVSYFIRYASDGSENKDMSNTDHVWQ